MSAPPPYNDRSSETPHQMVSPQTEYYPQPARLSSHQGAAMMLTVHPSISHRSVFHRCPFCGTQQMTKVTYQRGSCFWIIILLFCFLLGPFVLLFLLCATGDEAHHTCPNCNNVVGVHKVCA